MTVSRTSAAVVAVAAALVLAAPLGAQDTAPLDIVPPPRTAETPATVPAETRPEAQAESVAEEPRQPAEPAEPVEELVVSEGVEVDSILAVDPEAVGLYEEAEGGFGFAMWQGSARPLIEWMLPRLPAGTTSHVLNDLTRRLLLSTAAPPEGARSVGLLALRIERLAAMGEGVAMTHLLRAVPPDLYDTNLARARLDALLLTADNVGACAQARELVRRDDSPYWDKVLIFCRALAGQHDAAALGVALLRERGVKEDPSFLVLLRALAGEPGVELASLRRPTALHLAMLQTARLSVPEDAVESASPAIARAIAYIANAPLELRLRAAERAEAMGALPTDTLIEFYASVPFTPEDLANPLSRAETNGGPMTRALLYQAVAKQVVPAALAEVLRANWRLARQNGGWYGFATASRVTLEPLLGLKPSPELVSIAGDAARALLATGQFEAARAWFDLAETQSSASAEAAAISVALWPIVKLADAEGDLAWDETRLIRWWNGQDRDLAELARRQRASVLFGLLGALGEDLPAEAQLLLLTGPTHDWTRAPTSALWGQLETAAEAGRVGETVLLALVALGWSDSTRPTPLTLSMVVSSLRRAGLVAEARAVALDAALGHDL